MKCLTAVITLVKGKLEEVDLGLGPNGKVDVIVSEWMGYFLLYESMLDTVLLARDKYLASNGVMMPDSATLYLSAIEDQEYKEEKIDFWDDVYGFDYSCIKEIALREPLVDTVELRSVVCDPAPLVHLDLMTVKKEDLTFKTNFTMKATRNDYVHAFLGWFDIGFEACHKPVRFSTGPHSRYTHWKQTVFYTPETLTVCNGETIEGTLTCAPNARNNRDLDITIAYKLNGTHGTEGQMEYKMYVLGSPTDESGPNESPIGTKQLDIHGRQGGTPRLDGHTITCDTTAPSGAGGGSCAAAAGCRTAAPRRWAGSPALWVSKSRDVPYRSTGTMRSQPRTTL